MATNTNQKLPNILLPDSLLTTIARLINRGISQSTTAEALCADLQGKVFGIDVDDFGLRLCLHADDGRIRLEKRGEIEPDAQISGTSAALASLMLSADRQAALRDGPVRVSGDSDVAERFNDLLLLARPDIEDELSKVIGDVPAHFAGDTARAFRDWFKGATVTVTRSLGEFLQEEKPALPTRGEVEDFAAAVDTFANDVARAEQRIERLGAAGKDTNS